MPQMAPINWLTLFIIFFFIFFMYMALNYFMFIPIMLKTTQKSNNMNFSYFNWKW
uniref:ATP synthase complex subunit 8 n=1 Tax=Dialysis sp. KW-2016 TaxID=1812709 RepID=A0A164R072_9DIPT|nr:ATP synthase F0 subunit 8 [Dialysis sp. KW-2016]